MLVLVAVLGLTAALVPGRSRAGATGFKVVVNVANPVATAERRFLEDAFLKRTTRWSGGTLIHPIDLTPDSPARRLFSDDVLHRSVSAVKNYWQQLIFSGRDVPPPEVETDEQVIRYIVKHPGGVGYVSASATVEGVKVLSLR